MAVLVTAGIPKNGAIVHERMCSRWSAANQTEVLSFSARRTPRRDLALRVAAHYIHHGKDQELAEIESRVSQKYPRLVEFGQAAAAAKLKLENQWEVG